ncbi:restriction endonuclease [Geomonas sp. RF6]|uniref:restriction endonuclease n=1 Tax=Geomonas sp. RF6 TaxID=2897342 RepID=UPI001E326588|nr:restriction endonuclease [Geomonas sp. RF6]UFS71237.1 restriction endonuclease [Geomonas sp. RF6]
MINITQNEIDNDINRIASSNKVKTYTLERDYPYSLLSDEDFEILIYLSLRGSQVKSICGVEYDTCTLMRGSGDKGRDIIISKDGKAVGVIQCKKYKTNIDKTTFLKEIIKFCLHVAHKSIEISSTSFTYVLAAAHGLTKPTLDLMDAFNTAVFNEDIDGVAQQLIAEYASFTKDFKSLKDDLYSVLKSIKIDKMIPIDITALVQGNAEVISLFFDTKAVIDSKVFESILAGKNLNVSGFMENYRDATINNYSKINFFGLSIVNKPREVPLDRLFVRPRFKVKSTSRNIYLVEEFDTSLHRRYFYEVLHKYFAFRSPVATAVKEDDSIPLRGLFRNTNNFVVLGIPGAGKSSFSKFLLCKLLMRDKEAFDNASIFNRIPFRIELSKYQKQKSSHSYGILSYLSHFLDSSCQINYVSGSALHHLFETYETIFVFDGLDEVLSVKDRLEVRNDIANFLKMYPLCQGVITSRFESYQEVNFKDYNFDVVELLHFDSGQISEYVSNWYDLEEPDPTVKQKEIEGCLDKLAGVEDELKTNPLLLTLILLVYRNSLEIPASKLDIYESCTNTLVQVRDEKEKSLDIKLKVANKLSAFSSIAYWQYTEKDSKKAITYDSVLQHMTRYIKHVCEIEDDFSAKEAATEFLEFAQNRSIYVENSFTHKTFLEYFVAYFLYTNFHQKGKAADRDSVIADHIADSAWANILEVLICKIDKEQFDYEVIDSIVTAQISRNKIASVQFFSKIIKYLSNISKKSTAMLLTIAVDTVVNFKNAHGTQRPLPSIVNINTNIISLLGIQRFREVFEGIIDEANKDGEAGSETYVNMRLYIMENTLDSKLGFENIVPFDNEEGLQDPYFYLLRNVEKVSTFDEEYWAAFDDCKATFGKEAMLVTYYSRYGYNIFNNKPSFNWTLAPLFETEEKVEFINNLGKIRGKGISTSDIRKAITGGGYQPVINNPNTLLEWYSEVRLPHIKQILEAALHFFYKLDVPNSKGKNIPYHKLMSRQKPWER